MRMYRLFICCLLLLGLLGCYRPWLERMSRTTSDPVHANYGEKVRFAEGYPLLFPDFTLTYLGTHQAASANFPRGFVYHDFQIGHAAEGFTVSWSSGTGDIGPTFFEIDGQRYRLEMGYADELGALADDEVVVVME